MSTFKEIIARVDDRKPNSYSQQAKFQWLTDLNGKIAADAFLMSPAKIRELPRKYPEDMDREPLVLYPHDDLYDAFLEAKIDYANGDYSDYQNRMEGYNGLYSNFRLWLHNAYDPAQDESNSWYEAYFGTGGAAQ